MDYDFFDIEGLVLLRPTRFGDSRGYFFETFNRDKYQSVFDFPEFIQDNESKSTRGVVRGLHFQCPPFAQTKLVRCIRGEVKDFAVDLRSGSPTYGKSCSVILSEENMHQFLIPQGFAHGFVVLSEEAIFAYKVDNYYAPQCEGGIRYDDPALGLDWQLPEEMLQLSDKDLALPFLSQIKPPF
jgi:dTDP-4-dehydrorhamnose 3,5-epimerase